MGKAKFSVDKKEAGELAKKLTDECGITVTVGYFLDFFDFFQDGDGGIWGMPGKGGNVVHHLPFTIRCSIAIHSGIIMYL